MEYLTHFKTLWNNSSSVFPKLDTAYSLLQKKVKEKQFEAFLRSINACLSDCEMGSSHPLFTHIRNFLKECLDYSDEQLNIILSDEMVDTTLHFVRKARQFDAELELEEIFQACRNVWIMNGLQYLLGQDIKLTPSVFAYSMLYPYTDNFVDDANISKDEKAAFAHRFYKRLDNQLVDPANHNEDKIFQLVGMIEKQWPRESYPKVYESLLAIHKAQTKSSDLLSESGELTQDEIFEICVEKGGCSVQADGYMILGDLNKEQKEFLYNYGAYLQILDDLQDVQDDTSQGLLTCFSATAKESVIDDYASKTFWLGKKILDSIENLSYNNKAVFLTLMKKSIELFVLESVVSANSLFSKKYVKSFTDYSPVRVSYLRRNQDVLGAYPKLIFKKIEKIALLQTDGVTVV
ncbi:hypothetical protein [Carboxylicivirga linearis]|uniref:Uncharacterized protein n=1 Tax=Carboxylicivirga linearis TaxID=1628157 RepID=A0ABS5JV34_9BACT|nr:hypothetical protein [Carboxylicivirga linearis]MBS2098660.1 hypothetical protein [Carboxylicivirga linearis]